MTVNEVVETFQKFQKDGFGNYQVSWHNWKKPEIIESEEPEPATFFIMPKREEPIKVVFEKTPYNFVFPDTTVAFWKNKEEPHDSE